jgi:hypothetical protein
MKKWRCRVLFVALMLGLTLAASFEAVTHVGRGWLFGEAFFEGRPTSYWRGDLEQWDIGEDWVTLLIYPPPPPTLIRTYARKPSPVAQFLERWLHIRQPATPGVARPRLLDGGPDAIPVLQELRNDSSPNIRLFAEIGLGNDPEGN